MGCVQLIQDKKVQNIKQEYLENYDLQTFLVLKFYSGVICVERNRLISKIAYLNRIQ